MSFLGRYTSIIVTTIIFLTLVVGVLGANFYLSFQTEANAEVVNIAGRQRMLSQRIAKTLANVNARFQQSQDYTSQLNELVQASQLFNTTILAFKNGGTTQSTKSGMTQLSAIAEGSGLVALDQALSIWQPMNVMISEIVEQLQRDQTDTISVSALLRSAQAYSDININSLLSLMNDLTNYSESIANNAADRSRLIQTVGILASLLCFSVIMYLIFAQLRVADQAAQRARDETEQIFDTVSQGLFLIDKDGAMGSQQSKALQSIFGRSLEAGTGFKEFIAPLVSTDDLSKVKRYLKLLFNPHKKERLLFDLNPLNRLPIQIEERGHTQNKYLNFTFTRVSQNGQIIGVLTSVADITKEVKLERELAAETARSEQQIEMVKVLLGADSELLPDFLENSNATYEQINEILRDPAKTNVAFHKKAASILSLIHRTKGESGAMGLNVISQLCHEFESEIARLENKTSIAGDDFVALTVMLERLMSTNEQIDSVFDIVATSRSLPDESTSNSRDIPTGTNASLTQLATAIAQRQGKQIHLSLAGFDNPEIDSTTRLNVVSIASQLLRNALSHGIEKPAARLMLGKKEEGNITLALFEEKHGFKLICEDDGHGFDFDALGKKAVQVGLVSEDEQTQLKPNELLNLILNNSLSSKAQADQDAGRGVGLKVINDLAKSLGGKVALQTRPREGCRFIIRFKSLVTHRDKQPEVKYA